MTAYDSQSFKHDHLHSSLISFPLSVLLDLKILWRGAGWMMVPEADHFLVSNVKRKQNTKAISCSKEIVSSNWPIMAQLSATLKRSTAGLILAP